jgi:MFS family permease
MDGITLGAMTSQVQRPSITTPVLIDSPAPTLSVTGMVVLLAGALLPILDFFIVNVALPTMATTLHAGPAMLQLVVAGYGIAYALMLVVGGRLGDALGRRRMFVLGVSGFTVSSLLCGLAPDIGALVGFRLLQGLSAAMSQPQVLATFQATLQGQRRAQAVGWYGATAGIASSLGQLVGGLLVQANIAGLAWRPIFLVNVPIGVAALALTRRFVPASRSAHPAAVDRSGTALLALALVALLVPLTEGQSLGWPVWTWVVLALVPLAIVALVRVERRMEAAGHTPLLAPSLLRLPSVWRGVALSTPFFMGFGAFMFVFALTLQDGLHASSLRAGLAITPMMVAFFAMSLYAPKLLARYGVRPLRLALVIEAPTLAAFVAVVARQWPHVSLWATAPWLFVAGLCQAVGFVSFFRLILADVPDRLAGVGSGVLVTVQQASLALGVATLGTLFLSLEASHPVRAFGLVMGIDAGSMVLAGWLARWLRPGRGPARAATVDLAALGEPAL